MNSNSDESNNKPSIPNAIDSEKLAGMEFVAKMRATADKYGAGFIGGFKDPKTGELFINSNCLLYTSPSPRDKRQSRMPSSA